MVIHISQPRINDTAERLKRNPKLNIFLGVGSSIKTSEKSKGEKIIIFRLKIVKYGEARTYHREIYTRKVVQRR